MKRVDKSSYAGKPAGDAEADGLMLAYPLLFEHLTCGAWEDGSRRDPSTLLLFTEEGRAKVCLRDKGNGRVAFLSCGGFLAALEALERGLAEDRLDWREDRYSQQGKGGKRS